MVFSDLNNKGKAIGEIGTEFEKGLILWGVIADILEKYGLSIKADIKEVCDFFELDNRIRHYLYDRCVRVI